MINGVNGGMVKEAADRKEGIERKKEKKKKKIIIFFLFFLFFQEAL